MKHTEQEILIKAEKILKDLQGEFFNKENIEKVNFKPEKEISTPIKTKLALWTVLINEPVFGSAIFLEISDESGEPLLIRSKHKVSEIEKDSNGIYTRKS